MNYREFLQELETGKKRVAYKVGNEWTVDIHIKQSILDIFRNSEIIDMPGGFLDKELLITRTFTKEDRIRIVPGGTAVRAGAYIGKDVVIMPPSYINIGAYIDDGSMVDSHALVGSCAQIGKKVHLSAATQIGGVLEPIGNKPVIVEDDCFIGAGVILTEGILVRSRAVIAPGVMLSAAVPIYDIINKATYRGEIPENAVVVPGTRPITNNIWASENKLHLGCAIIIKYRDEKTSSAVTIENILR